MSEPYDSSQFYEQQKTLLSFHLMKLMAEKTYYIYIYTTLWQNERAILFLGEKEKDHEALEFFTLTELFR